MNLLKRNKFLCVLLLALSIVTTTAMARPSSIISGDYRYKVRDGRVMICGTNPGAVWERMPGPSKVRMIRTSGNYVYALTEDGEVYIRGNDGPDARWVSTSAPARIKRITTSGNYIYATTRNGNTYVRGNNGTDAEWVDARGR